MTTTEAFDASNDDLPPTDATAAAIAHIRAFRDQPQLAIAFETRAADPYADDPESTVDIYADDHGTEYWIDRTHDRLVHAGPRAGRDHSTPKTGPTERLAVAELRQIAMAHVTRERPQFPSQRPSLHPLEDNRHRELYFFRWDDFSRPLSETEMPPFVQVALYADGGFASFTDTLSR